MDLEKEYEIRLKRAYGIEELFEAIDEIQEINNEVNKYQSCITKQYFKKEKAKNYKRLVKKEIPIIINYQHQSVNCAYESMLQFNKELNKIPVTPLTTCQGLKQLCNVIWMYNK